MTLAWLTISGSLSPLLTCLWLWQIKEWRLDRLLEHLRNEGYLTTLVGRLRPAVVIIGLLFLETEWTLALLAGLTGLQIITRRQRYPVLTKKAGALLMVSGLLNIGLIAYLLSYPLLLPVIPLAQSALVGLAGGLLKPLDLYLKNKRYQQATQLRSAHSELTVIGITGSVGKTTVKALLNHVLAPLHPHCTPAYINSDLGIANWLITTFNSIKPPVSNPSPPVSHIPYPILIIEMGAYRTGEIALLCQMAQPTHGIITYLGTQHLALFGSPTKLYQAKGELLAALPATGQAFVNYNSPLAEEISQLSTAPVTRVSPNEGAYQARDVKDTATGLSFKLNDTLFQVPLAGQHNLTNCLLVIACAKQLGLDEATIAEQMASYKPPQSTFSVHSVNGLTVLDDTHNASAESFKAATQWAKTQSHARKILITPGLIELGSQQDQIHSELGRLCRDVFNEVVVLNKRPAKYFSQGYGDLKTTTNHLKNLPPGTLIVYLGRVPRSCQCHL